MDNQWYEHRSSEESWYTVPAERTASQSAPEEKAVSRRGWLTAAIIALLLLALIVVSAMLFGSRGSAPAAEDDTQAPSLDPRDFGSDFREFFENYYTPREEPEECNIPRVTSYEYLSIPLLPESENALTLHEVYEKCAPSVVAVTAFIDEKSDDSYYWGTGIVLTENGYIVTNSHVVEGSCRARVTLWNDEEYDVLLVGNDSRSDIAVLKIDAQGLIPADFCDIEKLSVGDQVVAIGNPLGKEFRSTMTEGIISGIDRDISYNGTTLTLLQTSAPINEGNSGGPLINMSGQVIGITNMKMSNNAGSVTIEGVGFAIPSRTATAMAEAILSSGQVRGRPALGLTLGAIPDSVRETYDMPEGLYVSAVSEGSDCQAKGILPGDVITAVNGEGVTATGQVTDMIAALSVGDTMTLSVWRQKNGGAPETFTLVVALVDVTDVY